MGEGVPSAAVEAALGVWLEGILSSLVRVLCSSRLRIFRWMCEGEDGGCPLLLVPVLDATLSELSKLVALAEVRA
jgi:hypothetical protein